MAGLAMAGDGVRVCRTVCMWWSLVDIRLSLSSPAIRPRSVDIGARWVDPVSAQAPIAPSSYTFLSSRLS